MRPLRQSTTATVNIGPFCGTTGAAYNPGTSVTGTFKLNGVPSVATLSGTGNTDGTFDFILPATNAGSAGRLGFVPTNSANYVPRREDWDVWTATVYDQYFGTNGAAFGNANVTKWTGNIVAADLSGFPVVSLAGTAGTLLGNLAYVTDLMAAASQTGTDAYAGFTVAGVSGTSLTLNVPNALISSGWVAANGMVVATVGTEAGSGAKSGQSRVVVGFDNSNIGPSGTVTLTLNAAFTNPPAASDAMLVYGRPPTAPEVWTNATRTLTGNVTVGAYAANQGPLFLLTGGTNTMTVSTGHGVRVDNWGTASISGGLPNTATPPTASQISQQVFSTTVDGVAFSSVMEVLFADNVAPKLTRVDNGDGTYTVTFYKQDATTTKHSVSYDKSTGTRTASLILH